MDDRTHLGKLGEKQAARHLRSKRYKIVTRNYHCPIGEIDLVALDGRTVVFVEVKTRTGREHADPEDAVNPAKQRQVTRCAEFFLKQTGAHDRACRFDVVAITTDDVGGMEIEHITDAFVPCW